jgi:hypothetical protein
MKWLSYTVSYVWVPFPRHVLERLSWRHHSPSLLLHGETSTPKSKGLTTDKIFDVIEQCIRSQVAVLQHIWKQGVETLVETPEPMTKYYPTRMSTHAYSRRIRTTTSIGVTTRPLIMEGNTPDGIRLISQPPTWGHLLSRTSTLPSLKLMIWPSKLQRNNRTYIDVLTPSSWTWCLYLLWTWCQISQSSLLGRTSRRLNTPTVYSLNVKRHRLSLVWFLLTKI